MHHRFAPSRRAHRVIDNLQPFILFAVLFLPVSTLAGGIELDSREYKLMLRAGEFAQARTRDKRSNA